jgi:hypothetical protein
MAPIVFWSRVSHTLALDRGVDCEVLGVQRALQGYNDALRATIHITTYIALHNSLGGSCQEHAASQKPIMRKNV